MGNNYALAKEEFEAEKIVNYLKTYEILFIKKLENILFKLSKSSTPTWVQYLSNETTLLQRLIQLSLMLILKYDGKGMKEHSTPVHHRRKNKFNTYYKKTFMKNTVTAF